MRFKFKHIICFLAFVIYANISLSQPCYDPGSLVSVFTDRKGKSEFLVFKFLKPYNSKGLLSGYNGNLFPRRNDGKTFHRLSFENVTNFCYDKLTGLTFGDKITGFEIEQKTGGVITYVFELAPGATIEAHTAYSFHNAWFVKISVR